MSPSTSSSPDTYARPSPSSPGDVMTYARARGDVTLTVTSASAGPAVLPSYAVHRTGDPGPTTASNASAIFTLVCLLPASVPPHCLGVQIEQPALRVVLLLQQRVCLAAVQGPELVFSVEGRGVERLAAAELLDLLLDLAVVGAVGLAGRQGHRRPEPEVHIGGLGIHDVEIPRRSSVALTQRACPDRRDAGLAREPRVELRC